MGKAFDGRTAARPGGRLLFGAANFDHQSEAFDSKFPGVREMWEATTGKVTRGHATDFWKRCAEDISNARSLGCDIFRFSGWTRIRI